jgi:hypothetical protein
MATLEQFLRDGILGPIRPGMSEAEVLARLGPPPDVSITKHPQILKYGGLQLTFFRQEDKQDRVLAHVGLYFGQDGEPLPEPTRPTDFQATSDTMMHDIREFLSRKGLEVSATTDDEATRCQVFASGA